MRTHRRRSVHSSFAVGSVVWRELFNLGVLSTAFVTTMKDQANSGITENPGTSDLPWISELKAMFADLLEGAKKGILSNVQESIDQIYTDFEYVES